MTTPHRRWVVDPADPRAPPQEVYDRMTPEEREEVAAALPSEFEPNEAQPPEGDHHWDEKVTVKSTLRDFFQRIGRRVYVGSELPVYYPDEPMFAPDIMAVTDVDLHPRNSWFVSKKGKGLDLALEIHVLGHRKKDFEKNVRRYARLGIGEYFIFDKARSSFSGLRLVGGTYRPIIPHSDVGWERGCEERLANVVRTPTDTIHQGACGRGQGVANRFAVSTTIRAR